MITRKRTDNVDFPLNLGSIIAKTKEAAKYLGVVMDPKLTFMSQIAKRCNKARNVVKTLSYLMSNLGIPRQSKRRFVMYTTNSIILYAGVEI